MPQPSDHHSKAEPLPVSIRLAEVDDLPAINSIYNHYVTTSVCTYQETEDSLDARRAWFDAKKEKGFPVAVAVHQRQVVGWSALGTYRERTAYRHTVENSVYVHPDFHGRGIGRALLTDSIERGRAAGYHVIIAAIDAEQTASIKLHRKSGFETVGHFKQVGLKFGRWLDVVFLQLTL